jgi:hypothetical protein
MYENGKTRNVENIPAMGGVNPTMIYYKNFCKYYCVPQYNNNKNVKKEKEENSVTALIFVIL